MGKNYLDNRHMKQMFDISAKLVSEQDEIYGVKTTDWEVYSWKYLSLIGDERVINLQRTKVYVFSDSVLCLGKIHENPRSNTAWEDRLAWFNSSPEYRDLDRIDGEPMEVERNISQDSKRCSSATKSRSFMSKTGSSKFTVEMDKARHQRISQEGLDLCRCSTTYPVDQETMKKCESSAQIVSLFAKRFGTRQWSFLGPGSEEVVFYL